ncbi:MAG: ATP-binding protein [Defluviitaleaceae bacterium]|nr:ATP-binding protein [Defluviitaleaceae bacterium]
MLVGANGSGKTRFIKAIELELKRMIKGEHGATSNMAIEILNINNENINKYNTLSTCNYSHSSLPLQSTKGFPPYVLKKTVDNLQDKAVSFEQTAHDTLLYLTYIAKYDHAHLKKFNDDVCFPLLKGCLEWDRINNEPTLLDTPLSELPNKPLSPGQMYLLRLCVAICCNKINENTILFLDEPECHLHPRALLEFIEILETRYKPGQIWVATHSIELVASRNRSEVWHMDSGIAKIMGSKTENMLYNIIGKQKLYELYMLVSSPDAYACYAFAADCLTEPDPEASRAGKKDPSTSLASDNLGLNQVVVDYGAGRGRFLEGCKNHKGFVPLNYYAYDKFGDYNSDGRYPNTPRQDCIQAMIANGISEENYYGGENGFEVLKADIGTADKVLMINVLHEIPPHDWVNVFEDIKSLLSNTGELIIVELTELTFGEQPHEDGFFVLQPQNLAKLFSCSDAEAENIATKHPNKPKVIKYTINKNHLCNVTPESVMETIKHLEQLSQEKIQEIKNNTSEHSDHGLTLAFWTHQYANASIYNKKRGNL